MKRIILFLSTIVLLCSNAQAETLELRESNTVVFRGVVNAQSVAQVESELQRKSQNGETLYLVLNTPGGSVDAGLELISFAKGLPVKVHTLTVFAASMGFQIAQNLGTRYIIPSGILMSHRASGGMEGQIPGELITRLKFTLKMLQGLDATASSRMGLTLGEYSRLIHDEYWTAGARAVEESAADKVVNARCGEGLSGTQETHIMTIFGPVGVTFSKCPLITGPLAISFDNVFATATERAQVLEYLNAVYGDKETAYRKYIKTGEYRKFQ